MTKCFGWSCFTPVLRQKIALHTLKRCSKGIILLNIFFNITKTPKIIMDVVPKQVTSYLFPGVFLARASNYKRQTILRQTSFPKNWLVNFCLIPAFLFCSGLKPGTRATAQGRVLKKVLHRGSEKALSRRHQKAETCFLLRVWPPSHAP